MIEVAETTVKPVAVVAPNWTAVAPDIGRLLPRIEQGDKVFTDATELSQKDRGAFLAQALRGLSRSYADSPPPATFRLIASPLVST